MIQVLKQCYDFNRTYANVTNINKGGTNEARPDKEIRK